MDALLTRAGWWIHGPEGYQGPLPDPPAASPPHRVAVVDTSQWVLTGAPEQAEVEAAKLAGPGVLLVLEPLDPTRTQAFACEAVLAERAAAWEGVELVAPYALALRAALEAIGPSPAGPRMVADPVGPAVCLTVLDGRAVQAARWVEIPAEALGTEILRTLHALADPALAELLAPEEALEALGTLAPAVRPLPAPPALALAGLRRLPLEAGFVIPAVLQARQERARRRQTRRRALAAATFAAAGLLAAAVGSGLQTAATGQQGWLEARRATLGARATALAPRVLTPRVTPRPLGAVARLVMALPDEIGFRELTLEPRGPTGWAVGLLLDPASEALRAPAVLEGIVRAAAGPAAAGSVITVTPVVVASAALWKVSLVIPGPGDRL